ncbi:hypothetical protein EV424DRAFT_1315528, partial [Suillus variegatus]
LYGLSSEEAAFFKAQIGIDHDEDLKRHILEVARYPCIHGTVFSLNISSYPVYEHILKLGGERPDAVLLDLGYRFGVDARKAAADGFPAENIIASNIINEFLELGHELFRTTSSLYPGCFLPGDGFDPEFLSVAAQRNNMISSSPTIDLSSLKSLNPLHGHISAINATRLFHLFTEDKQLHLAGALAGLLSAQPGSVICDYQGSPAVYSSNPSISKHVTPLRQASKFRRGGMLALLHLRHLIALVKACCLAVHSSHMY